jgi:acetoacetate decarboxylase
MDRLGAPLLDITVDLDLNVDIDTIRELMPEVLPLLSLRVLPGVEGMEPHTAQLIHWYSRTDILQDNSGSPKAWTGNASLKLYGSDEDPLDMIRITSILGGFYLEFDMELGLERILREY